MSRVAPPWQTAETDQVAAVPSFTREEAATLSADQLAFLERKRKGIMPQGSLCSTCDGVGTVVCGKCGGTGINSHDVDQEMFGNQVHQTNGWVDVRPYFRKGWPCWLCRGLEHIACADCEGVGMRGISLLYTGD